MLKTYKYRLYPTAKQRAAIDDAIDRHRWLYNEALARRRDAYQDRQESLSYYDQSRWLTANRKEADSSYVMLNFSSCQRTLRRLDKAFKAFFRRIKSGDTPGYPRFKAYNRFDSIEYTYNDGVRIKDGKLYAQNIGNIKVKFHRHVDGIIKTAVIRRKADRYYVCFAADCIPKTLEKTGAVVGLDMGISNLVTTSDGKFFAPPKYLRQSEKKLRRIQRMVSRRKKGSNRRRKAVRQLQRLHEHIANQRLDTAHKIAKSIIDRYDIVAIENLNTLGLMKNHHLAKSIADASWNIFTAILSFKAEEAGKQVVKVDPKYTSQLCSNCGEIVKKDLSVRVHDCPHCGISLDRDVNAAINILEKALGKDVAFVT